MNVACIIVTLVSRRAQLSVFSSACDLLDGKESTLEEAWQHVGYKGWVMLICLHMDSFTLNVPGPMLGLGIT